MFADKPDKNVHILSKTIWYNYVFWRSQLDYIQHHDATSPYEVKAIFPFLFDNRIDCTCFKVDYNVLTPLLLCLSNLQSSLPKREKDKLAEDKLEGDVMEVLDEVFFIPADSSSPDLLKLMASYFIDLDWGDISASESCIARTQNNIQTLGDTICFTLFTLTDVIAILKSIVATILHNIILLKLLIGQKVFRKKLYDRAIEVMKVVPRQLSAQIAMDLARALLDVEPRINQNAKLPCLRNPKIFDDWSQKEIDDFRQFCEEEDFDNWRAKVVRN